EDYFLVGLTLARAGRLEMALDAWEKAVREGGDDAELFDHLARLSFRLQHMDQAAEAARRLSRQPGWEARGLFLLGEVQALIENPLGAVEVPRWCLRHGPKTRR